MKRFITIMILFVLFGAVRSYSQVIPPITAQEPYDVVVEWMVANKFDDPAFLAYGAIDGELPGIPIELNVELQTGKATAWGYFFTSKSDPLQFVVVAAMKGFVEEYTLMEIDPEQLPDDIYISTTELDVTTCMNSDAAFQAMRDDEDFKNYMNVVETAEVNFCGMTINDIDPNIIIGDPYYSIIINTDAGAMRVYVHAIDGTVIIQTGISSVDESNASISLWPNPAEDRLVVSGVESGRIRIIGMNGASAIESDISGDSMIDISGLAAGMYIAEIRNGSEVRHIKFIKK
ncbi:MAG: T9SS type A sorting domain-containing protein [Candidatus Kapaibacterium sp.]